MLVRKEIDRFLNSLKSKNINVRFSSEKIVQGLSKNDLEKIKETLIFFKRRTGINDFSFINDKNQPGPKEHPGAWQQKRQKEKVIFNLFYLSDPKTRKFNVEKLKENLDEIEREIKTIPQEPEGEKEEKVLEKTGLIESSKVGEVKEEILPKNRIEKLREGLFIQFPDLEDLTLERDKKDPWIDLIRKDGREISVWQWPRRLFEIYIGNREYRLDENNFVLIEEETKIQYPLIKGPEGGIIIDLLLLREKNKNIKEFLASG